MIIPAIPAIIDRVITIRDNTRYSYSEQEQNKTFNALMKQVLNKSIITFKENLLIYPSDDEDIIKQKEKDCFLDYYIKCENGNCLRCINTYNYVGFIGLGEGFELRILSRFSKNDNDYFLNYLLSKTLGFPIYLLFQNTNTAKDSALDIKKYLKLYFPYLLNNAIRQGLFRQYINNEYNDSLIRGRIDISRHLRKNIPFTGNIAYSSRELSYDNHITQLIRHTIEEILTDEIGRKILNSSPEIKESIYKIRQATPSYNPKNKRKIINNNLKPIRNPYYSKYKPLQQLCIQILTDYKCRFTGKSDNIFGLVFNIANLWEEYIYTLLKDLGFDHPNNRTKDGGKKIFKNDTTSSKFPDTTSSKFPTHIYPDFVSKSLVLDAKYKSYSIDNSSEDLHQIISYMHCYELKNGGLIYPVNDKETIYQGEMNNGDKIVAIPFFVPSGESWENFCEQMGRSETNFINFIKSIKENI